MPSIALYGKLYFLMFWKHTCFVLQASQSEDTGCMLVTFYQKHSSVSKLLLCSTVLCSSSNCSGKVEIQFYMVPGFHFTGLAIHNGNNTGNIHIPVSLEWIIWNMQRAIFKLIFEPATLYGITSIQQQASAFGTYNPDSRRQLWDVQSCQCSIV